MTEAEQNVAAATTGAEEAKHDVEYASEETKNAVSTLKRETKPRLFSLGDW